MANPLQAQTSVPPLATTTRARLGMCLLNLELGEPAGGSRIPSLSETTCSESASPILSSVHARALVLLAGTLLLLLLFTESNFCQNRNYVNVILVR